MAVQGTKAAGRAQLANREQLTELDAKLATANYNLEVLQANLDAALRDADLAAAIAMTIAHDHAVPLPDKVIDFLQSLHQTSPADPPYPADDFNNDNPLAGWPTGPPATKSSSGGYVNVNPPVRPPGKTGGGYGSRIVNQQTQESLPWR